MAQASYVMTPDTIQNKLDIVYTASFTNPTLLIPLTKIGLLFPTAKRNDLMNHNAVRAIRDKLLELRKAGQTVTAAQYLKLKSDYLTPGKVKVTVADVAGSDTTNDLGVTLYVGKTAWDTEQSLYLDAAVQMLEEYWAENRGKLV